MLRLVILAKITNLPLLFGEKMKILFPLSMTFDVLYLDASDKEIAVPHIFEGEYKVKELKAKEVRHGYTIFMLDGDHDHNKIQDGGIFEVPNPCFNLVQA